VPGPPAPAQTHPSDLDSATAALLASHHAKVSQHIEKDQEASIETESPVFSVQVIGEVEIETEEGSGHLIPVVLQKDQSTTDDSNQDTETLPPDNTNTVDKEYISAVDYINKLEEKVDHYAKQMMGLQR